MFYCNSPNLPAHDPGLIDQDIEPVLLQIFLYDREICIGLAILARAVADEDQRAEGASFGHENGLLAEIIVVKSTIKYVELAAPTDGQIGRSILTKNGTPF